VIDPDGLRFSVTAKTEIDEILERHVGRGERVARLMLRPEDDPPPAK
jgi:hypothetical protein